MARFSRGRSGSSFRRFQSSRGIRTAKRLESGAGWLTMASTSPVRGSSATTAPLRSEEHTSELQSRQYLVCRLLLEKKKKITNYVPADNPDRSTGPVTRPLEKTSCARDIRLDRHHDASKIDCQSPEANSDEKIAADR